MLRYITLLISIPILFFSCSRENNSGREADQAYQDFREFVAEIEKDTSDNANLSEAEWEKEASRLQDESKKHQNKVNRHKDTYTIEQHEEVNGLQERFKLAYENMQKVYDDAGRRYRLRQDMLGSEVETDDLHNITPDNITATYQKLIATLEDNKDIYTPRDWEHIDGWWNALNKRKDEIDPQLKPADRTMIAEKQKEYSTLRRGTGT